MSKHKMVDGRLLQKRGVLSEDGIWNMLERNRELLERLGIQRTAEEGD